MQILELRLDSHDDVYRIISVSDRNDASEVEFRLNSIEIFCRESEKPVELFGEISNHVIYIDREDENNAFIIINEQKIEESTNVNDALRSKISDGVGDHLDKFRTSESAFDDFKIDVETGTLPFEISEIDRIGPLKAYLKRSRDLEFGKIPKRSIVIGRAGIGKTTFVRSLAFHWIEINKRRRKEVIIPIIFMLRSIGSKKLDENYINNYLEQEVGGDILSLYHDSKRNARFVFIFDGLDEVFENHRKTVERNLESLRLNLRDSLIVTTREEATHSKFRKFRKFEIGEYADYNVQRWCYEFVPDRSNWKQFHVALMSRSSTMEVLRNPLWLMWAAHLFSRFSLLPVRTVDVYENIVRALVDEWDSHRGVTRSHGIWDSPRQKEALLAFIAHQLDAEGMLSAPESQINSWISERAGGVSENACKTLASETGLLVEQESGCWGFLHRSIQEYFSAQFAVESSRDALAVSNPTTIPSSKEKIEFMSRLTSDPSYFVEQMLQSQRITKIDKSTMLLTLISEGVFLSGETRNRSYEILTEFFGNIAENIGSVEIDRNRNVTSVEFKESMDVDLAQVRDTFFKLTTIKNSKHKDEIAQLIGAAFDANIRNFFISMINRFVANVALRQTKRGNTIDIWDTNDEFDKTI